MEEKRRQTILGADEAEYTKKLNIKKAACIIWAVLTVTLNVLFTFFRNDDNHNLMLALNIVTDIISSWGIYSFVSIYILPAVRLSKLFRSKRNELCGEVISISEQAQRLQFIDCFRVAVLGSEERTLFLPCGTIKLEENKKYRFLISGSMILEVYDE